MSEPVIVTRNLSKWYGSIIALNGIDVSIAPGITALLGPNGAGKSTLLKLFTGQIHPSSGEVWLFGESVWDNPSLFLRVGICPEYDNFYEDMTALEFVTVLAKLSGFKPREARAEAEAAIERVGMTHACHRKIKTYSKGMRQRTKLAQALVHDPDLVFLDEPMTGLDPEARHQVSSIIRSIAAAGKSVLVSSHILHEVETLTEQILMMARGRVLAEGDIHSIREELEDHPYAIEVRCDRPTRVAQLLLDRQLVTSAEVTEAGVEAGVVVVRTTRAADVFSALPSLLLSEGIVVEGISSPDDNIEAVFEYLVRG